MPNDPEWEQRLLQTVLLKTLRRPPRLIPLWIGLLCAAQLTLPLFGPPSPEDPLLPTILAFGHVDFAIRDGQWWRLISSWLIHRNLWHLLGNVVGLLFLVRPVEAAWGPMRTWLICFAAGLAGALAALNAHTPVLIGVSGVVLGLCGATMALGIRLWPRLAPPLRTVLVFLPALFLLLRLSFDAWFADVEHLNPYAHQGGALAGLALGMWLQPQLPIFQDNLRPSMPRVVQILTVLTGLVLALSIGLGLRELRRPLRFPTVPTATWTIDGQLLKIPAEALPGRWEQGACVGQPVDPNWALRSGRTLCFSLQPWAALLLDRRSRILTMDAGDLIALRAANATGRFVQREPRVMVYPLGENLMWALVAPDVVLRAHERSLRTLLPPAGVAVVRETALAGQWLLPLEIPLALTDPGPLPRAVDLGSGVQLLIGLPSTLLDPQDRDALPLALASHEREFVRSQPGVMLLPLAPNRVAVLIGPDSRLDEFARQLLPHLPPPLSLPDLPFSPWMTRLLHDP